LNYTTVANAATNIWLDSGTFNLPNTLSAIYKLVSTYPYIPQNPIQVLRPNPNFTPTSIDGKGVIFNANGTANGPISNIILLLRNITPNETFYSVTIEMSTDGVNYLPFLGLPTTLWTYLSYAYVSFDIRKLGIIPNGYENTTIYFRYSNTTQLIAISQADPTLGSSYLWTDVGTVNSSGKLSYINRNKLCKHLHISILFR